MIKQKPLDPGGFFMDFENINYLLAGISRQRSAYKALKEKFSPGKTERFCPILTGTVPANTDIETSDLDIIRYWTNKREFINCLETNFVHQPGFLLTEKIISGNETIISNFKIDEWPLEIFGQNIPVKGSDGLQA